MPFTFSHPALILPLRYLPKKWFSMTGLIIGSLTPDFEYYIRMKIQSDYSHTLDGVFWFDLPLGILLAFIFHNIIRNCLYDNLPVCLQERFITFKQFEWNEYFKRNWIIVIISILIGAFSHLFWDSFTHNTGYFVSKFPLLSGNFEVFGLSIPVSKILQHGSTLLGGIIIVFALWRIPKQKDIKTKVSYKYWTIVIIITSTIIAIRLFSGLNYKLYGNLITTSISTFIIALILTPMLTSKKQNV